MEEPADVEWIIKAMIAVAAADNRLNAREVGLIQKLVEDHTGRHVDTAGIVFAIQSYAAKPDMLAELSVVAGSMSQTTKEEIIRAAYLMLRADGHVAKQELQKLYEIADALRLSENELDAIITATKSTSV